MVPGNLRDRRRSATEAAILQAAWQRFASAGPDGTSIRDVAGDAGCNHTLVARYFGSKTGLIEAVGRRLDDRIDGAVHQARSHGDAVLGLLTAARRDRASVQLLVRSGLGELGAAASPAARHVDAVLSGIDGHGDPHEPRLRWCTYGAASLVLGWLTYEAFVVAATGLEGVPDRRRDLAVAAAAHRVVRVAVEPTPTFARSLAVDRSLVDDARPAAEATSARDALVAAAVDLFAERGPAAVSVRDVARRAGVNQGLIYRHLGSKEALIAAAFEQGSADLFPAALGPDGFDIDTVIHQVHHGARAPRLIARILVDDVEVTEVREQFPVLRQLLDAYGERPGTDAPAGPDDPRIAVSAVTCMAMGSAIYGSGLVAALDLADDGSAEVAVAELCRVLLSEPAAAANAGGAWR